MTKQYLQRVVDSFTRDFPRLNEERARETIIRNVDELSDPQRVQKRLSFRETPLSQRILQSNILEVLLNDPDYMSDEEEIVEKGQALERSILQESRREDCFKYEPQGKVETLRSVLLVAVEDERVSQDELDLIRRLRRKLGLRERTQRILLAQLDHYPKCGNAVNTPSDFRDALNELQKKGVLFYCNRLDGGRYVIPQEVVPGVKQAIELQLNERSWRLLLDSLVKEQLSRILGDAGLPKSGTKDELIDRIVEAGLAPDETLDGLSNQELYDLCKSLPGAKVSGTKDEKIARVIDYFDNLVIKEIEEEASPGERYYQYYTELAKRDRENLLANKVIKKDLDMNAAFEEGTRYLFTEKLGLELQEFSGSDHADGSLEFKAGGDLLLWDTKSKESVYDFPESHVKQFKRYIRDSTRRVSCFLIIVPEIEDAAEVKAARLKAESQSDTDVALISAEDLKWVAEEWSGMAKTDQFNIEVFNVTGIVDKSRLESRMKLFL